MGYEDLPRVSLINLLTPMEELHRLRQAIGAPRILLKRDDLPGLGLGVGGVQGGQLRAPLSGGGHGQGLLGPQSLRLLLGASGALGQLPETFHQR